MERNARSSKESQSSHAGSPAGNSRDSGQRKSNAIEVPTLSLPKGGGAVKGIDEKFSVNAVNGTASFSIPIPVSKGRGFSPSLSLSYNSGAGNGIFGLGWSLSLPSFKRKTDKGLPKYFDAIDSDTYLFSEAEDLVPAYDPGTTTRTKRNDSIGTQNFEVRLYRPRIEGLFAKIERWRDEQTGEIRWRVITKDNVTTLFGWSADSRISDPNNQFRTYEWLPEFSFDDKGNCIQYIYKQEDDVGFLSDELHHRNRKSNGKLTYTNLYLQKVLYGNKTPYGGFRQQYPIADNYCFHNVFDYGLLVTDPWTAVSTIWKFRQDPFSDYRSGFEIRTTRLCRRILLYHNFETTEYKGVVKSLNLTFNETPNFTFLASAVLHGFNETTNKHREMPPVKFEYQEHAWDKTVKTVSSEDLVHAPVGLDENQYQFTDLFSEGLSGILTEQGNGWYYKHNLGNGEFAHAKLVTPKPSFAGLGGELQLADLDADGGKQLVSYSGAMPGYFELDDENEWQRFNAFRTLPNINFKDANTRMLDLNGDGKAEVLITEENVFACYESDGRHGFTRSYRTTKSYDEEKGPAIAFADSTQSIFLADMSGDGLSDIVRIRNGEVCYWPNCGHGKFGAKVAMDHAPVFDHKDTFNPSFLRLTDIDGSGTTDIIYLGKNKFSCWLNQSGNSFSTTPFEIDAFPEINNLSKVSVTDLLGNGIACIVWSSSLAKDAASPLRYIDLMSSKKPHIMTSYDNNMGKTVSFEYAASTRFYLEDKKAGKPWITKLHFPVHVVTRVTSKDQWRCSSFSNEYSYHHGYYDHPEREFRGFGRVEQTDIESFGKFQGANASSPYVTQDKTLYQPPIKTITWYHTGACLPRNKILGQFSKEYFPAWAEEHGYSQPSGWSFHENELPEPDLEGQNLSTQEWREALRACKGMPLRQEVYELEVNDQLHVTGKRMKFFSAATHNCHIRLLQPQGHNAHAVFHATESEAITYNFELDLRTKSIKPDPRIAHTLNLKIDGWGNVLQSIAVGYGRWQEVIDPTLPEIANVRKVQRETHIAYTENRFASVKLTTQSEHNKHRLPSPCEVLTYELTGIPVPASRYFSLNSFRKYKLSAIHQAVNPPGTTLLAVEEVEYHKQPTSATTPAHRIVEHVKTLYFKDDLIDSLPLGEITYHALPYETYKLAFTDDLLTDILGSKLTGRRGTLQNKLESGYLYDGKNYWICSGRAGFESDAKIHFFLPERYTDPFGNPTVLNYDPRDLYIQSSTDPLLNVTSIGKFDFRVLAPAQLKDINDNISEVAFDALGLPVAMAIRGKGPGNTNESGDILPSNYKADLAESDILDLFTKPYSATTAKDLLSTTTARFVYSFGKLTGTDKHPPCAAALMREQHVKHQPSGGPDIQAAFEYSDGSGAVLVKKTQAEPEEGTTGLRWIASGLTVLNNKGKPVMQYEPYFSSLAEAHRFQVSSPVGVTPLMYYDAAGRLVRTEMPDGTLSRVEFDNWQVKTFDANDSVLESSWYTALNMPAVLPPSPPTTFSAAQRAAWMAANHANTPAVTILDSLGRDVISIAHNKTWKENAAGNYFWEEKKYVTYTKLDAEGKPLWIRDARGNRVMEYVVITTSATYPAYDLAGNLLFQRSMDAGDRWMINNAAGNPLFGWDENGKVEPSGNITGHVKRLYRSRYDALQRPMTKELSVEGGVTDVIIEKFVYANDQASDKATNRLGQWKFHLDSSGKAEQAAFDFKGNLLTTRRTLTNQYNQPLIDWRTETGKLESETFEKVTEFDALNRMTKLTNWHSQLTTAGIYQPTYNKRGLLESETLTIGGHRTQAIKKVLYDAKGQRERQELGCNTATTYTYDPKTFRLVKLETNPQGGGPTQFQKLEYTYDPVGNITEIVDSLSDIVFLNNTMIKPENRYLYDALYRLIEASGRENTSAAEAPDRKFIYGTIGSFLTGNNALRIYTQFYQYDEAGNIKEMRHVGNTDSWTRTYEYEPNNNRLHTTQVGSEVTTYTHDIHGNILNLGKTLDELQWNHDDMIAMANLGGVDTALYNYGADKQRTRKRVDRGIIREDRIYLEGFEIYRRTESGVKKEEIETHHLVNGSERVLMMEHVTLSPGLPSPKQLPRYQFSNHLGTVSLELDDKAKTISYEETYPYGATSYHQHDESINHIAKRYKYTGMERDEETGLSYHSARYYVVWLGRWGSADPINRSDYSFGYLYSASNPVRFSDTNGKWEVDMHFGMTYLAGRMAGAKHGRALDVALAAQIQDDIPDLGAKNSKIAGLLRHGTPQRVLYQQSNNAHALGLTREESDMVAIRGLAGNRTLTTLFGIGLHSSEDFLPHANVSGEKTSGHQQGFNEDKTVSSKPFPFVEDALLTSADQTYHNPLKALATFEHTRELFTRFEGDYLPMTPLNDKTLSLLATFIHAKTELEKKSALTDLLRDAGVEEKEIEIVINLMGDKGARIKKYEEGKKVDGVKAQEEVTALEIWRKFNKPGQDQLDREGKVDIIPYLSNLPQLPIRDNSVLH